MTYQTISEEIIKQAAELSGPESNFHIAIKYAEDNPDKVAIVDYQINEDRDVVLKTGKEWVLKFNKIPGFTPTTVMQIGYKKHIFVIKKAEINKNEKVVFYISTKEIYLDKKSNKMKQLKKIPNGEYSPVGMREFRKSRQNDSLQTTAFW